LRADLIEPTEVVEVFDRLQFRSLKQRVLQFGGVAADATTSSPLVGPAHTAREQIPAPTPRHMGDEELAKWLRDNADSRIGLFMERADDGFAIGLATNDVSVRSIRSSDSLDHVAFDAWLGGPSPKIVHDGKALGHLLAEFNLALGGIVRDTRVAAWLLDSSTKSLALVDVARLRSPRSRSRPE